MDATTSGSIGSYPEFSELSLATPRASKSRSVMGMKQSRFLRYESVAAEDAFMEFAHPRPLVLIPLMFLFVFGGGITFLFGQPRSFIYNLITVLFSGISLVIEIAIHLKHRGLPKGAVGDPKLLRLERTIVTLAAVVTTIGILGTYFVNASDCSKSSSNAVDGRLHFKRAALCSRHWSFLNFGNVALIISFRVIPFEWVLWASITIVFLMYPVYGLIGAEEPLWQVWLHSVWSAVNVAFLLVASYEYEKAMRARFELFQLVKDAEKQLEKEQRALRDQYRSVIPPAVLERVQSRTQFSDKEDVTSEGSVMAAGVRDFGAWCTSVEPKFVVAAVGTLHRAFRKAATSAGMHTVGVMGDTIVAVGNLMKRERRATFKAFSAAHETLSSVKNIKKGALFRAVCHVGELRGGMVETGVVRYAVFGEAFDTAMAALAEVGPKTVLISQNVAKELSVANNTFLEDDDTVPEKGGIVCNGVPFMPSEPQWVSDSFIARDYHNSEDHSHSNSSNPSTVAEHEIDRFVHVAASSPHLRAVIHLASEGVREQREEEKQAEELRRIVERSTEMKRVWGIFSAFVDDDIEQEYVSERTSMLPTAASRTWRAYAIYATAILLLSLIELPSTTHATVGLFLLLIGIGTATMLATVPHLLSSEGMMKSFFGWSVTGVILPLFILYGCALMRPSAVGNDVRGYIVVGAVARSYCFSSTRWQAIIAPIAVIAGAGQYMLPGGYVRSSLIVAWVYLATIIVAEHAREEHERAAFRRRCQERLLLRQRSRIKDLQFALIKATVPKPVFECASRDLLSGQTHSPSRAFSAGGAVIVVKAKGDAVQSIRDATMMLAPLQELLDRVGPSLAVAHTLGDTALIVGPVIASVEDTQAERINVTSEAALVEGVRFCRELDSSAYGCLLDADTVIHGISLEPEWTYLALGAATTRSLAIAGGLDSAVFSGFLVGDRVISEAAGYLDGAERVSLGRMKIRGAGVVRLTKLTWPAAKESNQQHL